VHEQRRVTFVEPESLVAETREPQRRRERREREDRARDALSCE
jgi:hypothetical protein